MTASSFVPNHEPKLLVADNRYVYIVTATEAAVAITSAIGDGSSGYIKEIGSVETDAIARERGKVVLSAHRRVAFRHKCRAASGRSFFPLPSSRPPQWH